MHYFVITLLFAINSNMAIAGDPVIGKTKAIICIGCHGADGNSSHSIYPKLAEQNEAYLIKQLNDFKKGTRKEEHMSSMVEAINIEDIPDIAAYFSSQQRIPSSIDNIKSIQGKQIFQAGIQEKKIPACASCHGLKGTGNPPLNYPSLTGQHKEYLIKTLKDFRSRTRHNDINKIMRNATTKLTDNEINQLSDYISNLK